MRFLWGALFLIAFVCSPAVGAEAPPSPESQSILAYNYLKSLSPEYAYNTRFLSYYNYQKKQNIEKRVKTMRFWINQLHLETAVSFPSEVEGSDGLLYAIDLRDYGWNKEAFSAVARREPYFREPAVDSATSILLRKFIGIDQDPVTLHVEAIVRADWFFRETMESDRSPSYYDLLFSKQRFGLNRTVTKTVTVSEATTETYRASNGFLYQRAVPAVTKQVTEKVNGFVKFPKNEADFERIFAIDKFRDFLNEFKIDTRNGAVVEGIELGVSIVARQNRLIERTITFTGSYYKTFDVKETSGKRDFAEQLNKDFEFDAGEILTDLPDGGMAALLVTVKGDILESADNKFATDNSDLKFDARVRTPGSCFICHERKYIAPKNLVIDMLKAGVDIKFKKKEDAIAARGFFLDWEDKLEAEQNRFTKFILRTSGFKPGENATYLKSWRDEYDTQVTLAIAIKESGLSEEDFKYVAIKSTKARILNLLKGLNMPRKTWEVDGYKEIQFQLDASRK